MSRRLRLFLFWTHLVLGVGAGVVIAVMCFTGVVLAFEKEIVAWAERDVRKISAPAGMARLSIDELLAKVREKNPDLKPSAITISSDPTVAVLLASGRTNAVYVNPFTAEVSAQSAPRTRAFMTSMIEWHRYLAQSGDARPRGKMLTGACNFAFLFLAISGIYLWWPSKPLALKLRARGKARDWNWHNVIGFWSAPILVVLTATALPFSYKWANDGIYKLAGVEVPPAPGQRSPQGEGGRRGGEQKAVLLSPALEAIQREIPSADQITFRLGGGPLGATVKDKNASPRFSTLQVTLDPVTGAITKKESYDNFNAGRKIRSWTRFLHTGEAFGPIGQTLAGLASLGGLFLVWTGFALALRRFFGRKSKIESKRVDQPYMVEEAS